MDLESLQKSWALHEVKKEYTPEELALLIGDRSTKLVQKLTKSINTSLLMSFLLLTGLVRR